MLCSLLLLFSPKIRTWLADLCSGLIMKGVSKKFNAILTNRIEQVCMTLSVL